MVDRFGIRAVAESFRSRWCTDRSAVKLSDDSRLKCFSFGGGGAATNHQNLNCSSQPKMKWAETYEARQGLNLAS